MGEKKILIVEDDMGVQELLETRISGAGYQVFTACDGEEALVKVKEIMPDLILLDIMMPKINGMEVKRQLNNDSSTASIPVIFLTAKITMSDKLEGVCLGADGYITKPFDMKALMARIDSILNH